MPACSSIYEHLPSDPSWAQISRCLTGKQAPSTVTTMHACFVLHASCFMLHRSRIGLWTPAMLGLLGGVGVSYLDFVLPTYRMPASIGLNQIVYHISYLTQSFSPSLHPDTLLYCTVQYSTNMAPRTDSWHQIKSNQNQRNQHKRVGLSYYSYSTPTLRRVNHTARIFHTTVPYVLRTVRKYA